MTERVIGLLVTLAVLLALLRGTLADAQWGQRYRVLAIGRHTGAGERRTGLFEWYWSRMAEFGHWLDRPLDVRRTIGQLVGLSATFFAALTLLHYFVLLAGGLALVAAMFLLYIRAARAAGQAREKLTAAWLQEAIPRGMHALMATGDLELAFLRMAAAVDYGPMRRRLAELVRMTRSPVYPSPEAAFAQWADRMRLPEIQNLALATLQAKEYKGTVPLAKLWMEMAGVLGKDAEYRRELRARTASHRQGGVLTYGMIAGVYLLAYPFGSPYLSPTLKVAFWLVLGVMTFGLFLMFRISHSVDV